MKKTSAEKRISTFCARHNLTCTWQALKYNGRWARVETLDYDQHYELLKAARRMKSIAVDQWTCFGGGVWEGYIYLQDAADAERVNSLIRIEAERCENWWQVVHECLQAGLDRETAVYQAETLYPTPAI